MKTIFTTCLFCLLLLAGRTTLMAQTMLSVEGGNTGTWTAPTTGGPFYVRITARGGDGGTGANNGLVFAGGEGATLSGIFEVSAGQKIMVISGAKGQSSSIIGVENGGGGGAGAGAVNVSTNSFLLIAGGGNGGDYVSPGLPALTIAGNGLGGTGFDFFGGGGGGGIKGPGRTEDGGGGGGGQVSMTDLSVGGRNGAFGSGPGGSGMGGGGGGNYDSEHSAGGGGGQSGGSAQEGREACSLPGGLCQVNTRGQTTLTPQDGYVKVELLPTLTYYKDVDGDRFGNPLLMKFGPSGCVPGGYVADNTDFNDNDPAVHLATLTCPQDVTVNNEAGKCSAVVNYTTPIAPTRSNTTSVSDTFQYTGSIVQWTMPQGVTKLTITAKGAAGAGSNAGLGASIKGDFTIAQGTVLKILVGGTPPNPDTHNRSGGGGTFVTDAVNTPIVIAGGGGGGGTNYGFYSAGQIVERGGNGGGIVPGNGGTGGNGGQKGDVAGGGGGLLTDGGSTVYDGTGGSAFVNGGTAVTGGDYKGGFGGGGIGFDLTGGGGGGYSGGGGGDAISAGGGGGSYNHGINYENSAGVQAGNGLVIISYDLPLGLKVVQTGGKASGAEFPVGTTVNTFALVQNNTDTLARCSSAITVNDAEGPVLTCPQAQRFCFSSTGTYTAPLLQANDNCGLQSTTFSITGTTTRSGTGNNASGLFNVGASTITWTVTDVHGNQSQCFTVLTVNPQINVSIPDVKVLTKGVDINTVYPGYAPASSITLTANTSGGSGTCKYKWSNGATTKSITVAPTTQTTYTVTVTDGANCTGTTSKLVKVINVGCGGSKVNVCHSSGTLCIGSSGVMDHLNHGDKLGKCGTPVSGVMSRATENMEPDKSRAATGIYPNPTTGAFALQLNNQNGGRAQLWITDSKGAVVQQKAVVLHAGLQTLQLNVSDKTNGIYMVQVMNGENMQTFKVVLQR